MPEDVIREPKKRFKKRYVAMLLLLVLVFSYKDFIFVSKWNYKVTVKIQTPDGLKSGYAVRQIRSRFSPELLPEMSDVSYKFIGEAVAVDLDNGNYVFGILPTELQYEFFNAFPSPHGNSAHRKSLKYYRSLDIGSTATLGDEYKIVRFNDLSNPASVELVSGYQFNPKTQKYDFINNFDDFYGDEHDLKKVEVEVVRESVTHQVSQILPWISDYYNQRLDGERYGTIKAKNRLANSLSSGAFKIGDQE